MGDQNSDIEHVCMFFFLHALVSFDFPFLLTLYKLAFVGSSIYFSWYECLQGRSISFAKASKRSISEAIFLFLIFLSFFFFCERPTHIYVDMHVAFIRMENILWTFSMAIKFDGPIRILSSSVRLCTLRDWVKKK